MKLLGTNSRLIAFMIVFLGLGLAAQNALSQSISTSPGELSFGIPTGTPAPLTSTQPVTVNVTGTGQATLSGFAITGTPYGGDFTISGNTCVSAQTAPTTCQISVQFTSTQAAGVLETATLSFNSSTQTAPVTVPLNGAYGAIELFASIDINPSLINYVTWPNSAGYSVRSTTVNLSCPASGVTATLSSTPDGSSNVFQDNTIQVANTVNGATTTTTNVCYGGDTNFQGFTGFPAGTSNCFQPSYESAASGFLDQDPELASGLISTYGVSALNLQNSSVNALYPPILTSGTQALAVQLTDAGVYLGAGTLHLVTNCGLAGITPGGSITGDPVTTTPTQSYTFDSAPGQTISLENSVAAATGATFNPVVPIVTDIAVPQQLFYQLVSNTSAAPSVCLRMSSELDYTVTPPAAMCKGFLIQCYNPATGTTTGDNCDPTSLNEVRNLYYAAQFSSPDGPVNGFNYLYGPVGDPAADACSNVVPGGSCANGTGPGMLMGGDDWLCAATGSPCPAAATTQTPITPPTYSTSNCTLTGSLAGALCPLDILTEFEGAADLRGGSTTPGTNSILIPVANMPLPTASATVASQNSYGWIHGSSAVSASFTSNSATYSGSGSVPSANGFAPATAASPFSLTYGLSTWPTLPDTTYPVAGDVTNSNTFTTLTTPFCNVGGATPATFTSAGSFSSLSDGIYNLHYFTTDCAFSEGLIFNPTGSALTDPTANWGSFPYVTVGIDNVAPQVSSCTSAPPPVYNGWYNANFSQSCTVTDQYSAGVSGSGFLPLQPNSIQGSASETVSVSTNAAANAVSLGVYAIAAPATPTPGCDLAGNCVPVTTGPYNFDLQAPTIAASAGSSILGGTAITVTATCSDGAGSGIPNGGCVISGTPANYVPNSPSCSPSAGSTVVCGGTIPTATAESGTIYVTATDNVGNTAQSSVSYSVVTPTTWAVTPSNYAFGTLSVGQIASYTFTVYNPTTTSTAISMQIPLKNSKDGAGEIDPDDYIITSNGCPSSLAGMSSCNVTVTWTPDSNDLPLYPTGGSLAYLQVISKKAILAQSNMTGLTLDPAQTVSPATSSSSPYSFGSTTDTATFTLTNSGTTPLILASSNAIKMSGNTAFTLGTGTDGGVPTCTNGLNILPGNSCAIYVTFTARSKSGSVKGTVRINDNATNDPLYIYVSAPTEWGPGGK